MIILDIPDILEQKRVIDEAEKKHNDLKQGEKWYAVSTKWWENWESLENGKDPKVLGKIDNSELFDENLQGLKQEAQENQDYVLKNERVWKNLASWYQSSKAISGDVVLNKAGQPIIDLHPARFYVQVFDSENDEIERSDSSSSGSNSDSGNDSNKTADPNVQTGADRPIVEDDSADASINADTASRSRSKNRSTVERSRPKKKGVSFRNNKPPKTAKKEKKEKESESGEESEMLMISRYKLMKDLKTIISKQYNIPMDQLKMFLRGPDQEKWSLFDDSDEKDMEQTIGDALPKVGIEPWHLKVNKLSSEHIVEKEFSKTEPQIGQRLDAKYKNGKFLEAQVAGVSKDKKKVTIHFLSFDTKEDMDFDVDSDHLAQAYSKVPDWRIQLRVGEEIEVHQRVLSDKSFKTPWVVAEVKKIDRSGKVLKIESQSPEEESTVTSMFSKFKLTSKKSTPKTNIESPKKVSKHGLVKLRLYTGSSGWLSRQYKDVVVDLGSEDIAPQYTHLSKPKGGIYGPKNVSSKPEFHGVVGLKNLGNTCYMNSSLQCLVATAVVSEHFTSGKYVEDINRKNPIGFGGKIADAYADLVKDIFSDQYSAIVPRSFKHVAENLQSQAFAGYLQHDAHEFTVALLDGLHEDLNRVKNKPFVEAIESEGRPDSEVAELSWEGFKKRNQSILVDHMYGLLRSHLTCPNCGNEATKFDPFACWSVPLPISDDINLSIIFMPKDSSKATRYLMETHNGVKGKEVAKWMSEKTGARLDNLMIAALRMNKLDNQYYKPEMKKVASIILRDTQQKELVCFELEDLSREENGELDGNKEKEGTCETSSIPEESSDDEVVVSYIEVQFKLEPKNQYKVFRVSSMIRFTDITNAELHDLIWERSKFMFDGVDNLKADREKLYSLEYANKKVPIDDTPFVKLNRYNGDRIEVKISSEGLDALIPEIEAEPTSFGGYYRSGISVEKMNENLNIGQVTNDATVKNASEKEEENLTLQKCFEKFREEEQLSEEDMWYCGKCKDHVRATKKMDLYSTGDILCIHLKRFKREKYRNQKLADYVEFPIENFVLDDYILGQTESSQVFDLYGVIHHMGGAHGGHYVADIKTEDGWFNMNDSVTRKIKEEDVEEKLIQNSAYMLYYKKRQ